MTIFQVIGLIVGYGGVAALGLVRFIGKIKTERADWGNPGIAIAQIASAGVGLICLIIHWFVL